MPCCFAILPDESTTEKAPKPAAVFENLEDALDWGSRRFSGQAFRVKYLEMIALEGGHDDRLA